ncbi:phosphate propanoyltransferase [Anaeroselena agilis]|uniref:Phosphate propanoyltransferase n=1 Tax=Anaeroselena agilis TaxID=3063788 RepID=A0ABU3NS85_9FIRM|nr:phosphate propanoyltransferase [Selenomonadales bacterium 4137-cl]
MDPELIDAVVVCIAKRLADLPPAAAALPGIPVGVSKRHVHLSANDAAVLFGAGRALTKVKDLKQTGEFAAAETVTLVGPRGVIPGVRVLGPLRRVSQVELSRTDSFLLGIVPPVRDSGQLAGSAGVALVGPAGTLTMKEGVIVAARHIHMSVEDAAAYGVADGDRVSLEVPGQRSVCFRNVLVRSGAGFRLEFHVDTDEANAAGLKNGDLVSLVGVGG